jgi:hypothetical protein
LHFGVSRQWPWLSLGSLGITRTKERKAIIKRLALILFGLLFVGAALVAVYSGHVSIGSKYGSRYNIFHSSQQPKEFWAYVVIFFVTGVIFIFQAIRNRGE